MFFLVSQTIGRIHFCSGCLGTGYEDGPAFVGPCFVVNEWPTATVKPLAWRGNGRTAAYLGDGSITFEVKSPEELPPPVGIQATNPINGVSPVYCTSWRYTDMKINTRTVEEPTQSGRRAVTLHSYTHILLIIPLF